MIMQLRRKVKIANRKGAIGLLYISLWLVGFLVFQLYPFVSSFVFSFTDYSLLKTPKFVGLDNYYYMFFKDPLFWKSLWVTSVYVFFSVPAKLVFALLIALVLAMKLKGISIFRTIYYIPSIMGGSVAIAILWKVLFDTNGIINQMLFYLSIGPINWLGSPDVALYTIGLLTVWQFGSSMVIFLAGLKQIPEELYEAAKIDGASGFRIFFNITVPMLTPIIFFNLIMQMVNAFQDFTGALVITKGGPLNSTYLYALKLYDDGFKFFKMGYASALSWVLFIIIMLLTSLVFKSSSSWVHYDDGGKTV
ncbi:carbohydrate ABC transporter permease [Paenibacillus cremeus]|nr:sugar ABC transporter permease [Paenibacillus cremeus]